MLYSCCFIVTNPVNDSVLKLQLQFVHVAMHKNYVSPLELEKHFSQSAGKTCENDCRETAYDRHNIVVNDNNDDGDSIDFVSEVLLQMM